MLGIVRYVLIACFGLFLAMMFALMRRYRD